MAARRCSSRSRRRRRARVRLRHEGTVLRRGLRPAGRPRSRASPRRSAPFRESGKRRGREFVTVATRLFARELPRDRRPQRSVPVNGSRVSVGVVGLGYWGPNLARNFSALADCELAWCCDADPERRARFADQFRSTRFTDELDDLLSDPALDAVVLATPVPTHASLAVA